MNNEYLLDTNAAIALLNKPETIAPFLRGKLISISSISLGELYFGADQSAKKLPNIQKVEQVAQQYPIIDCDRDTARVYG